MAPHKTPSLLGRSASIPARFCVAVMLAALSGIGTGRGRSLPLRFRLVADIRSEGRARPLFVRAVIAPKHDPTPLADVCNSCCRPIVDLPFQERAAWKRTFAPTNGWDFPVPISPRSDQTFVHRSIGAALVHPDAIESIVSPALQELSCATAS